MSLRTTSFTMMGPGGANRLEIYARTCGSCVGKYYTSNLIWAGGYLFDSFNDRFLKHEFHVFAFLEPNNGVTYLVFLKILK